MKLKDLKMKTKLLLIAALPVVAFLITVLMLINQNLTKVNTLTSVIDYSNLSEQVNNVILNLQKERGFTAGFLSSEGVSFTSELPRQRKESDDKIVLFINFVDNLSFEDDSEFQDEIKKIISYLEDIQNNRSKIDAFSISSSEAISTYSLTISNMISTIKHIAEVASIEKDLAKKLRSLYYLYEYNERNGIERALFASAFGQGIYNIDNYKKSFELKGVRNEYKGLLMGEVAPDIAKKIKEIEGKDVSLKVERIVANTMELAINDSLDTDPSEWFALSSERIDLLSDFADEYTKVIISDADGILKSAQNNMIYLIAFAVILLVAIVVFITIINKNIKTSLDKIIDLADSLVKGDIKKRSDIDQKDEIGILANAFKEVQNKIGNLLNENNELIQSIINGKLDRRANNAGYEGGYLELVNGINGLCDAFVVPLNLTAEYVDRISKGDIPPKIVDDYKGDFNEIKNNLNQAIDVMSGLQQEVNKQIDNIKNGKLDARANASRFVGGWGDLVRGINDLNDAFVAPLNVTAEYVDRISKGDMPPKIVDEYKGDFNEIKNNLNQAIDAINLLIEDANMLAKSAVAGELKARADANHHFGDFRKIIVDFNNTLDAVINPLNVAANYVEAIAKGNIPETITDNYNGDFNSIKSNLNTLIGNLNTFIADINNMSKQHDLGDIDVKIEEAKFAGAYRDMAAGVNKMVFGHIDVKKKAIAVFEEFGKGNFEADMERLPGKKIFINNAINLVKNNLQTLSKDINYLINGAIAGKLNERADSTKYQGDWAKLVAGISGMIDAILGPINETVEVLERMSNGDLSVKISSNYKGDHARLKNAINTTVEMMPFKETIEVLNSMAVGNLTHKMTGNYKGDSAQLKVSLNSTIEAINEILLQVQVTVEEVTNGAMQVSDASNALSQGATEQAASLEEITSSMSEISSQTKTNAANADQANILTLDSRESADKGNTEMQQLNEAMQEINSSSQDISKIIKVIDEIAFQTNLLALNAAVEAARAGRHGKGFAVVAEEVRNLAARSAKAAKETSDLIESSIKTVEKGSNLANRTADVLQQIKAGAIKAADIVGEIATSSNEQAEGIEQINEGLVQIDQVTQTNTASAEESASASEELSGQAKNLKDMISRFTLSGSGIRGGNYNYSEMGGFSSSQMMSSRHRGGGRMLKSHDEDPNDIINLDEDDFGKY